VDLQRRGSDRSVRENLENSHGERGRKGEKSGGSATGFRGLVSSCESDGEGRGLF